MKYIIVLVTALFFLGCTSEQKNTAHEAATEASVQKEAAADATVASPVKEAVEHAVEQTQNVVEDVKESVVETTQNIAEAAEKTVDAVSETADKAAEATATAVESSVEAATQAVAAFDAEMSFKRKCGSCHGLNAEKSALGKSQIIKGWDVDKVMTALQGYKDGTYGGAMKGLMKSQLASFNDDELHALAEYISKQ